MLRPSSNISIQSFTQERGLTSRVPSLQKLSFMIICTEFHTTITFLLEVKYQNYVIKHIISTIHELQGGDSEM
jgi:hypothetical protein